MNKFALVGKNISHSKSPSMYRKLISLNVEYDLLDFDKDEDIPSAKNLLAIYDGINITSPYKKHFLKEVELTPTAQKLGAINCLKKENGKIIGENTDYLAIRDILNEIRAENGELEVAILGDGVMSKVVEVALQDLSLNYIVLSRKRTDNFNRLNLNEIFVNKKPQILVINTCAREYVFSGKVPPQAMFWDFNYNFLDHSELLIPKVKKYFDGLDMLERQAFYAVAFWSNRKPL